MFSEYYFYLVAYDMDTENHIAKYFRFDRIKSITEHRKTYIKGRREALSEWIDWDYFCDANIV